MLGDAEGDISALIPEPYEKMIGDMIEKGEVKGITDQNVFDLLELAHKRQMGNLEAACKNYIVKNPEVISKAQNLSDLCHFALAGHMVWLLTLIGEHCARYKIEVPKVLESFNEFSNAFQFSALGAFGLSDVQLEKLSHHPLRGLVNQVYINSKKGSVADFVRH